MKNLTLAIVCLAAFLLGGCAMTQSPVYAWAYTDVKGPVTATSNTNSTKVGTAQAKGILGLVTTGDASIEEAARSAGITRIHHVDYHSKSILGIVSTYTVMVYGE